MSAEWVTWIDESIEEFTRWINKRNEQLKDPSLSQDVRRILQNENIATIKERAKWIRRKQELNPN